MAGYGFLVELDFADDPYTRSCHLGSQFSVFQAEMQAIKSAADYVESCCLDRDVHFYVDNQAALKAIQQPCVNSRLILDTILALTNAGEHNTITLHWVKAHVGNPGNEKADELAKTGAEDPTLLDNTVSLSKSLCMSMIRKYFLDKWQQQWTGLSTCRQTKHWMPAIDKMKSKRMLKFSDRTIFSGLVQLLTGHNFLNRHTALVEGAEDWEDALCRLCFEDDESVLHVMTECPALALPRYNIFEKAFFTEPQDWTPAQILDFCKEAHISSWFGLKGTNEGVDEEVQIQDENFE